MHVINKQHNKKYNIFYINNLYIMLIGYPKLKNLYNNIFIEMIETKYF